MSLRFLSPIHKASRQIASSLEEACADADLTATEGHMLSYLRSYSPSSVSELHRVFGVKRSSLTSMLDRLASRGWIARELSARDRRAILVSLTDRGRHRADRVQTAVEELEARIGAGLTPADLEGFYTVLSAIDAATDVAVSGRGSRPTTDSPEEDHA
jgi:DNA-binding MarR family transcriptional regulator